jgi:hypothetical protein
MTERAARPRTSLGATVLRLAAIAAVAAVLVWAALVLGALRSKATAAVPSTAPAAASSPGGGQIAATPAPVTTQTS